MNSRLCNASAPHARAIAVESDREFGVSVLQRIDAELSRPRRNIPQGTACRIWHPIVKRIAPALHGTLLVIDEFQEFSPKMTSSLRKRPVLLDRLVRRVERSAFSFCSIANHWRSSGLSRSTIGQMAVRIALANSEADSH